MRIITVGVHMATLVLAMNTASRTDPSWWGWWASLLIAYIAGSLAAYYLVREIESRVK